MPAQFSDDIQDPITKFLQDTKRGHPRSLTICHVNINSIRNKFENVHDILTKGLADIFIISENKIDESFPNAQFECDGFKMYRRDRTMDGGGLMCYVRSDIPQRRRNEFEGSSIESPVIEFNI